MKAINKIINSIKTESTPHINPTEIYNEGWMTRLLVYYSIENNVFLEKEDFLYCDFPEKSNSNILKNIEFDSCYRWTSEALVSSPFVKKNAKPFQEGYTHADIAIGDFDVDYLKRGEIILKQGFNLFGIIEAKMGSNLSKGTTNAPNYNQASRNVACIAHNTQNSIAPTFFGIVAPITIISKHNILEQVEKQTMLKQITERYNMFPVKSDVRKDEASVLKKANDINVFVISYEKWIAKFSSETNSELNDFYNKCLTYNKIKQIL